MGYKLKKIFLGTKLVRPNDIVPGIYHNATKGVISMSADGKNWFSIADKNLGATTAWNYGDTDTAATSGTMYQRGNNYGFPWNTTLTKTPTKQSVAGYGPGNYYSNSTFVGDDSWNGMDRWGTSVNQNMRGYTTGTDEAKRGPCPAGWHIPTKQEWIDMIEIGADLGARTWNSSSERVSGNFSKYTKISGMAGRYNFSGGFVALGGYYWTCNADSSQYTSYFSIISSLIGFGQDLNNYGMFIRPFANGVYVPDSTRDQLYPLQVAPVNETFSYTGSDQVWTVPYTQDYIITCKGAGGYNTHGGLGQGTFTLTAGDKLSIVVGRTGYGRTAGGYGFGGSANGGANSAGSGLAGVFTGNTTVTANDSARALVIGGGAGGMSSNTNSGEGGQGGGTTGGTGLGRYGTAGAGGTQTGRGSGGNAGSGQFQGGNGSGSYGYGGGGGRRGGNGSIGDSSADDDKGGGGGSGYVHSSATNPTLTKGGGSNIRTNGEVTIVSVNQ